MNRDEFFLLVCDGETLDTDEVMAEYDRLTAQLAAAQAREARLREALESISGLKDCWGPGCFYCETDTPHHLTMGAKIATAALAEKP